MIDNMEANELLDDIMLGVISNMSTSELREELAHSSDEYLVMKSRFLSKLQATKQPEKKNRLIAARQGLNEHRQRQNSVNVSSYLTKLGKDAKSVLIDLMLQGKLPENLTVAFREGKDVTDEDAEQILDNLISMGVVDLDDKKD
jgi:citrate lyase alpha subunit